MVKRFKYSLQWLSIISILLISGCGGQSSQGAAPDYEQVKQMVKDILQTEDGRKAIQETLKAEEVRNHLIFDGAQVQQTVHQTLLSPKGIENFQKMMEDPKFTSQLAKALQKEDQQIHKELMKDPEYQKMLIDVMKDPVFEQNMLDLMKSTAYRQQMMTVMKEALQSPLFQDELFKLMVKAQEEAMKPKQKEKQQGGEQEEDGQGGQSGSQGGGGQGGGGM